MRLFHGEAGRWIVVEWLPPFALVAAIVPFTVFGKKPGEPFVDALLHVLSAGDLLAVTFCLIFSGIAGAFPKVAQPEVSSGKEKSYFVEVQLLFLVLMVLFFYAIGKITPPEHEELNRAISFSVLNVGLSFWASVLIYGIKKRGRL